MDASEGEVKAESNRNAYEYKQIIQIRIVTQTVDGLHILLCSRGVQYQSSSVLYIYINRSLSIFSFHGPPHNRPQDVSGRSTHIYIYMDHDDNDFF